MTKKLIKRTGIVIAAFAVTFLAVSNIPSKDYAGADESGPPNTAAVLATIHGASFDASQLTGETENTPKTVDEQGATYPVRVYKPLAAPSDPQATQWWTQKTGMETAWSAVPPVGAPQTTVAVIDTGFALKHEEFTGRWAINTVEQGATTTEAASVRNCTGRNITLTAACNLIDDNYDGVVDNETGATTKQNPSRLNCTDRQLALDKSCNLIDDDSNGYADDVSGWDFASYDNNPQAGEVTPSGAGTAHGTMVAGILAATGNNAKGIAGVDWSAKILPLQALNDEEYGNSLTVAKAIRYAADRNVDVISLSIGTDEEDPYIRMAVQYALDNGSIVVAASGNDGCDCMSYPARYDEVIAVGAEASAGGRASFSSYGSTLDIVAPGNAMTTTTWKSTNQTSSYATNVAGTSFATPYISGLLSKGRAFQPNANWSEITATLLATADHTQLTATQPTSPTIGFGYARADAFTVRANTLHSPNSRYYFGPLSGSHILSSARVYQCNEGEFPSTKFYTLVRNQETVYTINALEKTRAQTDGWTVAQEWYACVGLPSDRPGYARTINLNSETKNNLVAKPTHIDQVASPHGMPLYVNPANVALGRPAAISSQPSSLWLGDWSGDVRAAANNTVSAATANGGSLATIVAYNIPHRDCGSYSSGGATSNDAYKLWIRQLASGIGQRRAIVILEPDALAQITCLTTADQTARYSLLTDAVAVLSSQTKAFIYIDAGHSSWIDAATMAGRLQQANIAKARGFALNVSSFQTTTSNTAYGNQIHALTGKQYVIDTSRNGRGATTEWCNPRGRGLGKKPTTSGQGAADAYLWIKAPGESDGTCGGGPVAGEWWDEYALELIENAVYE